PARARPVPPCWPCPVRRGPARAPCGGPASRRRPQGGQRVLRSEPTASEADLSFAGLSDLLAGVLPEVINGIPGPQREALEVALLLRPAVDQPPTAHAV